ncbi:adhesion G-protein coupled receptor G1-like [Cyprinus carpio]|uniref:Adhesion G-protein coupled receptor G1-like n=1 Tax=Cyprinus carpio TaxID=7962 RepID=A0A9Q9YPV8_CYPCA|nr:adhesion G-protein coupled receptor G1-like [Cyprinus carpio]
MSMTSPALHAHPVPRNQLSNREGSGLGWSVDLQPDAHGMAFNSGSDSAVASTPEGGDSLSHNAAINISQSDSRRPSARASVTGEASSENSTDQCFWNSSSSTQVIEWTCPSVDEKMNQEDEDEGVEPSEASDALDELESDMEEMENNNISNAVIVMRNATGLLQIHDENTTTEDMCYSSNQNTINDVDCQSIPNTNFSWAVKIPKEAVYKSRRENNGCAFVAVLRFINMRNKNQTANRTVLNNEVYGIAMKANISNLTENIEMFITQKDPVSKPSCHSWDGNGELNWTTFGCETETIEQSNIIKCSCSHLTFFAVLMIPQSDANKTALHLKALTFITSIGCGISMFFISVALFMHFLLRKAESNQATKILMNMFVALSLLNASFLSNESVANTGDNTACVFIALLLHYSMLASFTWFFIQALHLYLWLIRQNVSITNYMRKITVLGWGLFLFLYYYHIHNDVAGHFSDDPENTDSTESIT